MQQWVILLASMCYVGCSAYDGDFEKGVAFCNRSGHHLGLPRNQSTNDRLKRRMSALNVTSAWIGAQIRTTFWHRKTEDEPFHDQGCYSLEEVNTHRVNKSTSLQKCAEYCRNDGYKFIGLSRNADTGDDFRCFCTSVLPTAERRHESECVATCDTLEDRCGTNTSVRILLSKAYYESQEEDANSSLHWREPLDVGGLCASRRSKILQQVACSRNASYRCTKASEGEDERGTWFESDMACRQGKRPSVEGETGWSEVKAWAWKSWDGGCDELPFSNWAPHQPNFSVGECITISEDGLWRTSNCTDTHRAMCGDLVDDVTQPWAGDNSGDVSPSAGDTADLAGVDSGMAGLAVGCLVLGVLGGLVISRTRIKTPCSKAVRCFCGVNHPEPRVLLALQQTPDVVGPNHDSGAYDYIVGRSYLIGTGNTRRENPYVETELENEAGAGYMQSVQNDLYSSVPTLVSDTEREVSLNLDTTKPLFVAANSSTDPPDTEPLGSPIYALPVPKHIRSNATNAPHNLT